MKKPGFIAVVAAAGIVAPTVTVMASSVNAYGASLTLHYGAHGTAVKALQRRLTNIGYHLGNIDGIYGHVTESAVKQFQSHYHLSVDGIAGPNTFAKLSAVTGTSHSSHVAISPETSIPFSNGLPASTLVRYGSRGSAVKSVQSAMNHLGFDAGTVDGIYGPQTYHAIRTFQQHYHLQLDGIVGSNTWKALSKALGGQASSSVSSSSSTSKQSSASGSSKSSQSSKSSNSSGSSPAQNHFPSIKYPGTLIRFGSRGEAVKEVQSQLNHLGFNCGHADGIYGPLTYRGIRRFQQVHHLHVDGIVGPKSWPELFAAGNQTDSQPKPQSPPKQSPPITSRGTNPLANFSAYSANHHKVGTFSSEVNAKKALASLPGGYVTNGAQHVVWHQALYDAYDKSGHQLGDFASLQKAEQKLQNVPGGYVKDSSGHVVFTEPDVFAAYKSPAAVPVKEDSLAKAVSDIRGDSEGFVVNEGKNTVVNSPSDYFYLDSSGKWVHHVHGVTVLTGSSAPSWAQKNHLYVGIDNGTPPYYYDFYEVTSGQSFDLVHKGNFENPFRNADLRYPAPKAINPTVINHWFASKNSPLSGLGSDFINAQNTYGVNVAYLAAHSYQETGNANYWSSGSIPVQKNNLFGYGAFTGASYHAAVFPSKGYSVAFEGWFVRQEYLNNGAIFQYKWPTLDGMNRYYATDKNWSSNIAAYMDSIAHSAGQSSLSFTMFSSSRTAASPSSSDEPVYRLSGAAGTIVNGDVNTVTNYELRPELVLGARGYWVRQVQSALNSWGGAGAPLTVDGNMGTTTVNRLKAFQSSQHLTVDGVCGPNSWRALMLVSKQTQKVTFAKGTKVNVDEIRLGKSLSLWYHVTSASNNKVSGWVDAGHIKLDNVYKLAASKGYEVQLANGVTMPAGSYVVSKDGKSSITYANQLKPGSAITTAVKSGSLLQVSQ